MPCLLLDGNGTGPAEAKRGLAARLDASCTAMMDVHIRRGRPAERRMEVARKRIADCVALLGSRGGRLAAEFMRHAGDEMGHPALCGDCPGWAPHEAN